MAASGLPGTGRMARDRRHRPASLVVLGYQAVETADTNTHDT